LNRYCLSASTTRFPLEDGKISLGSDEENQELRLASSGLQLLSPLVNETVNALGGSLKLEITDIGPPEVLVCTKVLVHFGDAKFLTP